MKKIYNLFLFPFIIINILKSIDQRLKNIEQDIKLVGNCVENKNHRGRYSIRTGHWND